MKKIYSVIFLLITFAIVSNLAVRSIQAQSQAIILPNHTGYLDVTTIPITYHVVGEISNIGSVSLKLLNVTATFSAQDNSFIGSSSSYTFLDVLLPGRKTPFEAVWAGTTADQIYNYSLALQFSEYASEKPLALQIVKNSTYIDEAGFQKVNGTVENLATSNATGVKVVATFYNAEGKVVGATYDYTMPSTIMPGHTESFDLELRQKAGNFSTYALTAESIEYAIVPEFPQPTIMIFLILAVSVLVVYDIRKAK